MRRAPMVSIIWGCNISCSYCLAESNNACKTLMSTADAKQLFSWLSGHGVEGLSILGGEPTIHPYFNEITTIIHDCGIRSGIATNGLFNGDKREAFLKGVYTRIAIHINDEWFYTKEQLKKLKDNLKFLSGVGAEVEIRYVIHSSGINMDFIQDMAKVSGSKIINFSIARPETYGKTAYLPIKSVGLLLPGLKKIINGLREQGYISYVVALYPKCVKKGYEDLFDGYEGNFCCLNDNGKFDVSFLINPDLTANVCLSLSNMKTEKKVIEFNDLEEVKESFRERFEDLRQKPVFDECLTCPDFNIDCQGGCLVYKIFKHGTGK